MHLKPLKLVEIVAIMIMFYVNYVYTFVLKKVWDQFNESISSDIILKVTVKINILKVENDSGYLARDFLKL
jgi:hypothetical protein